MADLSDQLQPYKVPAGGVQTFAPSTPDELLNTPVPQNLLPKASPTRQTTEPVSHWGEGLENFKQSVMDPLTLGISSNTAAIQGLNAWGNPNLTPEQMASEVENDAVLKAQQHRDDFNNAHEWSRIMTVGEGATEKGFYAADLGGAVIEAIPQFAPILVGGAYGATAGAMTGTLPGIILGGLGGMSLGAFAMVGGHHTYDMMQRGVKRETAIAGGVVMGSVGAATQLVGGALLGKVVPEMATTLMRSGSFRTAIGPIALRLLQTAGINTGLGQVQSVVDSVAKYYETTATGNAPGTKPLTYKEAQDAFMVSLMTGAATNVTAEAAMLPIGLHAGLNSIKTHAERMTAEYNFQQKEIARQHLEAQEKAKAEAEAETQRTTEVTGQIVEKKAKPEKQEAQGLTKEDKAARRARAVEKGEILDQHMMTPNNRKPGTGLGTLLDNILDEGIQNAISDWRGLMTVITKLGTVSDMTEILDPKTAGSAGDKLRKFWENRFQELRADADLDDRAWQKMQVDFSKQAPFLEYRRQTASTAGVKKGILGVLQRASVGHPKMTHAELIQIHSWLLDKEANATSRLSKGNGYTRTGEVELGTSTQEVIERYLDSEMPDWRKYEQALLEFYQEFEPVVDEASFNRSGRRITRNETYGGKILQTDEGGNSRETNRRASARAGTTLTRGDKVSEVETIDVHRNLMSHINEVTHDITHLEFEQDAQAIFNDPARRKWIKANIGERTLSMIDDHINDIVLGYNRNQKSVDKIAAWLRENMYGHFLLGKPEQSVKQLTGAIICLETIGPDAAIRGWEYMLANPAETEKLMAESGIWLSRAERRDPDYNPAQRHKRLAQAIGGRALEVGDMYGASGAAFPIYLEELRTSGNKKTAVKKFETAIATQSSGRIEDMPALFRGNAWLKLASVMAQEPTAAVQRISIAWRKYRASGELSDLRQYWRVVAITHLASFLYQLTGYAYWYPFYSDEERAKKLAFISATFSPYTGLPMMGQFLGYAMTGIFRYSLGVDISKVEPDVFPSFGAEFIRLYETLLKEGTGAEELDMLKILQESADLAGVTHGLPVGNYMKGAGRIGRTLTGENN